MFTAAELARRRLAEGTLLSHPDAVALAADTVLEQARRGGSYEEVRASVHGLLRREQLLPGVAELLQAPHQVEASSATAAGSCRSSGWSLHEAGRRSCPATAPFRRRP